MGATCHHNDPRLMELADGFLNGKVSRDPWLFYLWGHAYEFDIHGEWERFEEFCRLISGHEDIYYGTNREVLLAK